MNPKETEEIIDFYAWSRDYWCQLSKDSVKGFSGLLNFGCWDTGQANLHEAQDRLFDVLLEKLRPFSPGSHGLEIGCGIGGNSLRLCAREQIRMTAIDIAAEQLNIAARLAREAGLDAKIRFIRGDSMEIPFAAEQFDFSVCIESTFHYSAIDRFVAEQARVLRPGAVAVIADITCEQISKVRFRQGNHFYSVSHMLELLKSNDLELVELRRIGPQVFEPLYEYVRRYNGDSRLKVAKYWNLVLCNYANLAREGLMGYDIFIVRKPVA